MAKFNGKKGKHRNLAESVLNAYFNSDGIGIKGPKPVEKKVPTMSHGGPPPHPPKGTLTPFQKLMQEPKFNYEYTGTHLEGNNWAPSDTLIQNDPRVFNLENALYSSNGKTMVDPAF